jgi:hypothetical protein
LECRYQGNRGEQRDWRERDRAHDPELMLCLLVHQSRPLWCETNGSRTAKFRAGAPEGGGLFFGTASFWRSRGGMLAANRFARGEQDKLKSGRGLVMNSSFNLNSRYRTRDVEPLD